MHSVEVASLPVPRTSQSRELDTTPQSPRHESLICNRKTLTGTHSRSWFVFLHLTLQVKLLNFKSTVPANKRTNASYIQPAQHLPPHTILVVCWATLLKCGDDDCEATDFRFVCAFVSFMSFGNWILLAFCPLPKHHHRRLLANLIVVTEWMYERHPRTERNVHRHPEGNI